IESECYQPNTDLMIGVEGGLRVPVGPGNAVFSLRQEGVIRVDTHDASLVVVGQIERSARVSGTQTCEVFSLVMSLSDQVGGLDFTQLKLIKEGAALLLVVDVVDGNRPSVSRFISLQSVVVFIIDAELAAETEFADLCAHLHVGELDLRLGDERRVFQDLKDGNVSRGAFGRPCRTAVT